MRLWSLQHPGAVDVLVSRGVHEPREGDGEVAPELFPAAYRWLASALGLPEGRLPVWWHLRPQDAIEMAHRWVHLRPDGPTPVLLDVEVADEHVTVLDRPVWDTVLDTFPWSQGCPRHAAEDDADCPDCARLGMAVVNAHVCRHALDDDDRLSLAMASRPLGEPAPTTPPASEDGASAAGIGEVRCRACTERLHANWQGSLFHHGPSARPREAVTARIDAGWVVSLLRMPSCTCVVRLPCGCRIEPTASRRTCRARHSWERAVVDVAPHPLYLDVLAALAA